MLRESAEQLYAVFSDPSWRCSVEFCEHCGPVTDALYKKPLRDLTASDLERYCRKAMTTWGNERDFKHFLPRILELLPSSLSSAPGVDIEVVLGKLRYAKWREWPARERDAIGGYLCALWDYLLARFPNEPEIDEWLCGIARAVDDLTSFLQAWWDAPGPEGYLNFAAFGGTVLHTNQLADAVWWEELSAQKHQVLSWLREPRTLDLLKRTQAERARWPADYAGYDSSFEAFAGWVLRIRQEEKPRGDV